LALKKRATALGVSKEELKKELRAGKSLKEIASKKGIGEAQLFSKLKEQIAPALKEWIGRKGHPRPQAEPNPKSDK